MLILKAERFSPPWFLAKSDKKRQGEHGENIRVIATLYFLDLQSGI